MPLVMVLSGAVGSGKSTLAEAVGQAVSALRISTRELIIERTGVPSEREALQQAGDDLDGQTDCQWVADEVALESAESDAEVIVVDAVRRTEQVEHLRRRFKDVRHVHVTASPEQLLSRHLSRKGEVSEPVSYEQVRENATEQGIEQLAAIADVVIDIGRLGSSGMAAAALAGTGRSVAGRRERLVDVLIGGQYGSEGKGNICSLLAPEYQVLVRVGGPNAGHIVYDPKFKFAQLPSGTLHNPAARLIIGPATTLSLKVLAREMDELAREHSMVITPERLSIDPQAIIIEDEDIAWEKGALEVIGSTKQGVGAATARKILGRGKVGSFGPPVRLARDIKELRLFVRSTYVELEQAFAAGERVLLEGTQGTDISLHHGMWPHVTSRDTTASGCLADAGIAPHRVREVFMVTRTYPIRVGGNSGFMGVEVGPEVIAERSGLPLAEIKATETGTISGKPRRIGLFDLGQVMRAAALNGATCVALTFGDYLGRENREAQSFNDLNEAAKRFVHDIESATGVPVGLIAVGPGRSNIIDRRGK